jgi:hypothetical protein
MRRDLVDMTVDYEAAAAFSSEAARLLNKRERQGDDSAAYQLMRPFIPVAKYRTARMSVETTSYAMEILGGNGYVRGHTTERLLRDAQVLPIWEGPSNVLALDTLRALNREDAHEALVPSVRERLDGVEHPLLEELGDAVEDEFVGLQNALATLATEDGDYAQYHAKRLADLIFDVVTAALLLEEAQLAVDEDADGRKALVARRFVEIRFDEGDAYGSLPANAPPWRTTSSPPWLTTPASSRSRWSRRRPPTTDTDRRGPLPANARRGSVFAGRSLPQSTWSARSSSGKSPGPQGGAWTPRQPSERTTRRFARATRCTRSSGRGNRRSSSGSASA